MANLDVDGGGADIDMTKIRFVSQSLGSIVGTVALGIDKGATKTIGAASLSVGGGGIPKLLDASKSYGPVIAGGLAASGVMENTDSYETFMRFAQTLADSGDPINYAASAYNNHPLHVTEVLNDLVVPNKAMAGAASATQDFVGISALLSDLVSLLSGRNFEIRTFEDDIAEQSFAKLKLGVNSFINETNFKRFLMIIKSAGFISPKLIRSQNAINFAYVVYLKLKELGVNSVSIERYVRRWLVYSILTGRYSGSPESAFDYDIKQISHKPFDEILKEREEAELSDAFWSASLPQSLDTSVASSPYFHVFLASQVKANDRGFLSTDVLVGDLISLRGDIHHLFPKDYLKKNGLDSSQYNQIANYVYMQSEINIKVGNKPPKEYFDIIINQMLNNHQQVSGLSTEQQLLDNLKMNCVPTEIQQMSIGDYNGFLALRRKLMATKIKDYYHAL